MAPADFVLVCRGYENKITRESGMFRKMAFISLLPYAEKGFSFNRFCKDFWPLPADNTETPLLLDPNLSKEMFDEIIKGKEKLLRQIKRKEHAGRSRTGSQNFSKRKQPHARNRPGGGSV